MAQQNSDQKLLLKLIDEMRQESYARPDFLRTYQEVRNLRGESLDWFVKSLGRIIGAYRCLAIPTIVNAIHAETNGHPNEEISSIQVVRSKELKRLVVMWFELNFTRLETAHSRRKLDFARFLCDMVKRI